MLPSLFSIFLGYSFWTQGLIIWIGIHVHNIHTNISICCVYMCMAWNLSAQQITTLNSRNGSSDTVLILLSRNPLLTWYPGLYSSREEFESVVLTWLKLFKTKNRDFFSETNLKTLLVKYSQISCTYRFLQVDSII